MIIERIRARSFFSTIAALDERVFSLDRAALAIGLEEYPDMEVSAYLRKLDTLAARTQVIIGQDRTPINIIECLNEQLFVREGLHGNNEDYYNPRNSFLNEVLDKNSGGIPISLSVIYIEVARRLDFHIDGVGFPGHFIVKHTSGEKDILIDPFNQGRILTLSDCQDLLDRVYGGTVSVHQSLLQAMGKREIITRMLYNLKGIYYQKEEYDKALSVVERLLILNPGLPSEIRDRGLLYMQTCLFAKALADLESYIRHALQPEDKSYVQGHIRTLRGIVTAPN